jgi:hypothetical protein
VNTAEYISYGFLRETPTHARWHILIILTSSTVFWSYTLAIPVVAMSKYKAEMKGGWRPERNGSEESQRELIAAIIRTRKGAPLRTKNADRHHPWDR